MSEWQLLGLITVAILLRGIATVTAEGVFIPLFNRYFLSSSFFAVTIINLWLLGQQKADGVDSQKYPALLIAILALLNIYLAYRLFACRSKKFKIENKQQLFEWVDPMIVSGIVAFLLITFIMRTYFIPSESMVPTLQKRDFIIVNKLIYRFKKVARNDIVVFVPPIPGETRHFIKRVIGLPGEELKIENGVVYINGIPLKEPFTKEPPRLPYPATKIDKDKLLVMGDNRNNSDDSRFWGFLPLSRVEGKAVLIFWPPPRVGLLR